MPRMHNNVVESIEEGFVSSGFSTLRFNFRGVGYSEGTYDEGSGETRDVVAACTFMRNLIGHEGRLVLAGYSFGAWVASKAAGDIHGLKDLFLVAYPFSRYEPAELRTFEVDLLARLPHPGRRTGDRHRSCDSGTRGGLT